VSFWSDGCKYCNHVLGCVCSPWDLERWGAAEDAAKIEYWDRLKQERLRREAERDSRRRQVLGDWRHFPGDDDGEVRLRTENVFLVGPWGAWWRLWEIGRECSWCGHVRASHLAMCKPGCSHPQSRPRSWPIFYGESTSDWYTMDSAKIRAEEITRNRK
jgi:hypothetical protein